MPLGWGRSSLAVSSSMIEGQVKSKSMLETSLILNASYKEAMIQQPRNNSMVDGLSLHGTSLYTHTHTHTQTHMHTHTHRHTHTTHVHASCIFLKADIARLLLYWQSTHFAFCLCFIALRVCSHTIHPSQRSVEGYRRHQVTEDTLPTRSFT